MKADPPEDRDVLPEAIRHREITGVIVLLQFPPLCFGEMLPVLFLDLLRTTAPRARQGVLEVDTERFRELRTLFETQSNRLRLFQT